MQVNLSGSTWTTVAAGSIGADGTFGATARNVPGGAHAFRAYVGGDPSNGVVAGYSPAQTLTVPGATPSPAAGNVRFARIQYNSPGTDNGSNVSLNGEWVQITNGTRASAGLGGWTLRDAAGNVYRFPSAYRLGAGDSVYVHTGRGTTGTVHRYWGRTRYVWNNTGDTAVLRTAAGTTVDTCKWGAGSGVIAC